MSTGLTTIVVIGVLQAVSIAANAARTKIIAVTLGPEGVGVASIVDQVIQAVMHLAAFSLPLSCVAFLSRSYTAGDVIFRRTALAYLLALCALSVTGTAVALMLIGAGAGGDAVLRYRPLVMLGVLSVPALATATFGVSVLASARRARRAAFVTAATAAAMVAAAAVGIPLRGLTGLYWSTLAANVVIAVALLWHLKQAFGLPSLASLNVRGEIARYPDLPAFSVGYFVISFAYPVVWLIARASILQGFGEAVTGLLQALIGVAVGFGMVFRPVNNQLLLPLLSGPQPWGEKFQEALDVQRRLTVGLGLLALVLVLFPRPIITVLYSGAFTDAGRYLHLFVVAELIFVLGTSFQAVMLALGDMKMWVIVYALGYGCFGVLSWPLGRQYGVLGVALAAIAANVTFCALALARLRRRHGFRLPSSLGGLMTTVGASTLAIGTLAAYYDDVNVIALTLKVVALLAVGAAFVAALEKGDRMFVFRVLTRLQARSG